MSDASFHDGREAPLNLGAFDGDDVQVLSTLAQDAVFPITEMRRLEPALSMPIHCGVKFKGARHVRDPQELVNRMVQRFETLGGTYRQSGVDRCAPDDAGVTVHLADQTRLRAGHMALTAGARSRAIAGTGAERIPLGTERGYHIMYKDHGGLISRPTGWAEGGFYATPMAHGLRIAGTVEITDLDAPFNTGRAAYLQRKSQEMFGDLGAPNDSWLGHRPTLPDAMPVIGPSPASDRVLLAFGHQHLGLTLGAVTGRVVIDLITGQTPLCDIADFSPRRFGNAH